MVNKVKKFNKKRGLTLIEVIIAMAIMVIVGGVVTTMTVTNNKILSKIDMKSELQMEGQIIQTQLMKVALESNGVIEVEFIDDSDLIQSITIEDSQHKHKFKLSGSTLIYKKLEKEENLQEKELLSKELSSNISSIQVIPSTEEELKNSEHMEFNINLSTKRGAQIIDYRVDNYIVFRNFKK